MARNGKSTTLGDREHLGILTPEEAQELRVLIEDLARARRAVEAAELIITVRSRQMVADRGIEPTEVEVDWQRGLILRAIPAPRGG